jgi:hypothetical protein
MKAQQLGHDIDAVGSQHVEGGMSEVNDTGYAEDK